MNYQSGKDIKFTHKSVATQKVLSPLKNEIIEHLGLNPTDEHTNRQIKKHIQDKGLEYADGTINNALSELRQGNLVLRRNGFRENYYRINLDSYMKSESTPIGVGKCLVGKDGFVAAIMEIIKAEGFEYVARIHDVSLRTNFWLGDAFRKRVSFDPELWVNEVCHKWKRNEWANSWHIRLFVGYDYRVTFQVYDVGTLGVQVKCVRKAIPDRLNGICLLDQVIREGLFIVFGKNKRLWSFPDVNKWVVTFWHRGKDSKKVFPCRFNVLYENWFGGLSRIYVREEDNRLRLEGFENPNVTMGALKSEKEELELEWGRVEEEKRAIPGMVASCFASCLTEYGKGRGFIDLEPVS